MIVFPAIDLMNGNVVRLSQGDFQTATVFDTDPLAVAKQYEQDGATWLHVIDLDGAKTGQSQNLAAIKAICANTTLHVQVGGGIRSEADVKRLLDLGVTRVIVGTLAVKDTKLLQSLVNTYNDKVLVSVDSKNGYVTYSGWQDTSLLPTLDFCLQLEQIGVTTIVYTDIAKDGMMEGPNFDDYVMLSQSTNLNVIASGGVSTLADVETLASQSTYGAIIGKALYLNKINLKEAIRCSQDESFPV